MNSLYFLLALLLSSLASSFVVVENQRKDIGCLYGVICKFPLYCFDDKFFGVCVNWLPRPAYTANRLNSEELKRLESLVYTLEANGFTWTDEVAQCIIKYELAKMTNSELYDVGNCGVTVKKVESLIPQNGRLDLFNRETPLRSEELYWKDKRDTPYDESQNSGRNLFSYEINSEYLYPNDINNPEHYNAIRDSHRSSSSHFQNSGRGGQTTESSINHKGTVNSKRRNHLQLPNKRTPIAENGEEHMSRFPDSGANRFPSFPFRWMLIKFRNKTKMEESNVKDFVEKLRSKFQGSLKLDDTRLNKDGDGFVLALSPKSTITPEDILKLFSGDPGVVHGYYVSEVALVTPNRMLFHVAMHPNGYYTRQMAYFIAAAVLMGLTCSLIVLLLLFKVTTKRSSGNKQMLTASETKVISGYESGRGIVGDDSAKQKDSMDEGSAEPLASKEDTMVVPRVNTSCRTEEPISTTMTLSTGHAVLNYLEEHLNKSDKLDAEWKLLCSYEAEGFTMEAAKLDINRSKNRYHGALPYDHNRVILEAGNADLDSDYINASSIVDCNPKRPDYIITQSPMSNTVAAFWTMVWEKNCTAIVNLTRLKEDGIVMCHKYWPSEGSDVYGNFMVHLVSEHGWNEECVVRSFYLKNLRTGETKTITQFHFVSWPENEIPQNLCTFLEFRRKVNKAFRNHAGPCLVHCNDGCGRSGTYILIDVILNRLSQGVKEVDIAATLEYLRDQRAHVIKQKEQFEFVLTAIAQEVNALLKQVITQQ